MFGSAERGKVRLISREIICKNSNICDHDTSTTDRQTDRQLGIAIP